MVYLFGLSTSAGQSFAAIKLSATPSSQQTRSLVTREVSVLSSQGAPPSSPPMHCFRSVSPQATLTRHLAAMVEEWAEVAAATVAVPPEWGRRQQ